MFLTKLEQEKYLRCKTPTTTSLWTSGNMLVNCVISASVGTLRPADGRCALPVNSLTHSLMTEVPGAPAVPSTVDPEGRAVVTTSSASDDACVAIRSSGNARLVRRGAGIEPTRGSRKRDDTLTNQGGSRYVFKLAISER